ncbi:MAG: M20 family metallopeptidase [Chloroflexota bacterium]|jgi:amidohydrolase
MTTDAYARARTVLEEAYPGLIELSHRLHEHPELGFEEVQAAGWLADALEAAGFETQRGYGKMPTAVVGSVGSGPLHIAICSEYDALPDVGHACGHNVICTAGLGAALALAPLVEELGLKVTLLGTPAEEGGGGKLGFIEGGFFDDVHAAMMVHPYPMDVAEPNIIAVQQLVITYTGVEAHASGYPWDGVNASDAMVVAQTAIALLRQQLLPSDRVHGIVTKGGEAANIIPRETQAEYMVRAGTAERLQELVGKIRNCFEAGALATGCSVDVKLDTAYTDLRHDSEMAAIYQRHAESLGREFVEPPAPVSTDMGNVSYEVPSIHPFIGVESHGAVPHQAAFADACATPSADQAVFDGALAMALTVIDLASDESIRTRLLAR